MTKATGYANSAAASISMLFIVVAIIFGLIQKKVGKMKEWVRAVVAIALLVVMFIIGMKLPMYATKSTWIYIVMAYLFLASVMPMWLLMEPRDYMTTFMLLGMIIGAVVGVIAEHPTMKLNAFSGFNVDGSYLFPTLFVTIACGAVSGFHSLVSSGTSSKTISNEKDMPMVGYGAMVVESLLGVIALVVVGAVAVNGTKPEGTPFSIFSTGVAGFFEKFGIPVQVATVFMTMCVSALALTSLDSVARIGRMSFQELFYGDTTDTSKMPGWQKVLTNKYFATIIVQIDDHEITTDDDLDYLVSLIRGDAGTDVTLKIYRERDKAYHDVTITREIVEYSTVSSFMIDDKIGYVRITQFIDNTDELFQKAVEELKNEGMQALMIDVRSDPGGMLTTVVNICDYLLPEGT